ncbi:putative ATPase [Mycolicibacterium flavescens]|uniref:ATP-binding protein n=1 Tax=Mycobacterium neumannii TaxID=2048551 RepID=UPI000B93B054|nr:adenylate/guanylate cyclase domain-containing protein [Mycobacterium neumannii]VEG46665.1 putative ATPase [Mycolicibacterium flavescens]
MNGGLQAAPSAVVTFLFTDIEGSTRRWEADADAMRRALASHDDTMRHAVEVHDGWLFKHTGDGICAAFSSPRQAVDAAVDAQRSLHLPVRMGIATGEAECREGDYFGAVCNRTARLMAAGHGGQLLIDRTTADLVSGVDLVALGPRRLRDIARPVDVFQVVAEGLRSEFPPLRTLDASQGNLRPPATSFVGRESEVAEVATALKSHRLVTLTGVGGVGKTRLAQEVAARLQPEFPDGVWMIELGPVTDPAAVPDAVAAVLGLNQQPGLSVADSVASALEGRIRLLLFDNCEHVLDAAADVIGKILDATDSVTVLATSREGLRLNDEQLRSVPPLDVRSSGPTLFVERASADSPTVTLEPDADAVVDICRRLDGIPLALELAASRLMSVTVTELRDHLDDRFRVLVGSRRGLERHQTLRAAVQWSYDLLDDAEKDLLTRCSVFAGGFDLDGAAAVAHTRDKFAILDLLESLVRKSLLVADQTSGRTRFSMLETIRQFAEEQLVSSGGADDARCAHARYFAGRRRDLIAIWDGPRQREAHDWLNTELPNLRSAFRWASDHADLDGAVDIVVLTTFIGYWVEVFEAVSWAEEVLEPARREKHPQLPMLYVAAAQCSVSGRSDDYLRYSRAALAAIESGRYDPVPDSMEATIHAGYMMRDPGWCVERCRALLAASAENRLYTRQSLVFALVISGRVDEAIAETEGLLADAEATDNPHLRSAGLLAYGFAYRDVDPDAAYAAHLKGLSIAQETGNRQIASIHAVSLGRIATVRRNPVEACEFLAQALRNYFDSGSFYMMSAPILILANLLFRLGHHEAAATTAAFVVESDASSTYPEIHDAVTALRETLGRERYESLAREGRAMSNAAMAAYALEAIDRIRRSERAPTDT